MKLKCNCGNIIFDGTDSLPHKGHILADKDLFPILDKLDRLLEKVSKHGRVTDRDYIDVRSNFLGRTIYQCPDCGRIHIWDATIKGAFSFQPEDADVNKRLLEGR